MRARYAALILALLVGLYAIPPAGAQSVVSGFPQASQPLGILPDAVLLDQGAGCPSNIAPCTTSQSPSLRVGQPFQDTSPPSTPFLFQPWLDTNDPTLLPWNFYDGNEWVTLGTLDTTNHAWIFSFADMLRDASNATLPAARANLFPATTTALYYATDYGTALWTGQSGQDVGPSINLAYDACAAGGGGTVIVPAGAFYYATEILNNASGCGIRGAGVGSPRDTVSPSVFQAYTRLIWNGAAGATATYIGPVTGANTESLYAADVEGIVFDCNATAAICIEVSQVSQSRLHFGVSEPRSIGAHLTTVVTTDSPGTQNNDIDIWSRATATSDSFHPTGIMFDGASGSSWNISLNQKCKLYAWHNSGDGIVFGNSDNNHCDVATFPEPAVLNGRPVVVSNANYTSPNGVMVAGTARNTRLGQVNSPVYILGAQTGSTLTEGAGNTGTAHYNPTTIATNSPTGQTSFTLNFASTAGLAIGQSIDCGAGSNQPRNTRALALTGTTVLMESEAMGTIASGKSCVFGWGLTPDSRPGNYVITSTDGAGGHYSITAPFGGHSESGITVGGGVLAFRDIVFPISGAPLTGDTWTIGVPSPSLTTTVDYVDQDNSTPIPAIEPIATIGTITVSSGQVGLGRYPDFDLSVSPYNSTGNIAVGCQVSGCRQYRWQADNSGQLAFIDQTGQVNRSITDKFGSQRYFGAFASRMYGETHTTNYPVTSDDSGKHFNNTGAGGEVDFTLPLAEGGLQYCFTVTAVHTLKIIANGADTIALGGTVGAAGGSAAAAAVYASICLESPLAGRWITRSVADAAQWTVM